ncbi:NAD(P)-dependent dehydrogenase, short-chain alcohol dehydrogenase family [Paenibacillus sophorae]|uniref:NAD(P)-dependent dehydrogenase, short-chain alcohol dehydrogenase family n=1 Tax=Paenibacillus sophorae TaxID=1333845 RepID=A0A1H8K8D8_9BACL|nr:SDR family NAD(P)-dependent oxidoreductase [Paenibacillus sophorae]QWU13648.1 SDR family oxidoreductase [Paenibacillus sophorae]SEN89184.1 NAD(P)-dependent dehydrogenase, short-chain alcohol dehydrogenase family [Paenibacillus sophorae]
MSPNTGTKQRFAGRTAIITGAGSGIGRATAIQMASEGANIALFDLVNDRTSIVERKLNSMREGCALAVDVDTSDPGRMEEAVRRTVEHFGGLDIVFANAGINGSIGPIEELSIEDWQRTLSVNLTGTFLSLKYTIPHMKKKGKGSIIITSSINGNRRFASFGFSPYSTTKAGQVAFAKMAALELAKFKVRVNVISPGAIATNIDESTEPNEELESIIIPMEFPEGQQPLADGPGKPEDVAKLVCFLASDESSHITGAQIVIDGAESLLT